MSSRYRDFLRLIERWPLDTTKPGRDIAEHIRHCVKTAYDSKQGFTGDPKNCNAQYESLKNIINNTYSNLYKRTKPYSSTGLTREECKLLLSKEILEELAKGKPSFVSKYFNRDK